jgi:hypothetical protein
MTALRRRVTEELTLRGYARNTIKVSHSTQKIALCGIEFFNELTLGRECNVFGVARPRLLTSAPTRTVWDTTALDYMHRLSNRAVSCWPRPEATNVLQEVQHGFAISDLQKLASKYEARSPGRQLRGATRFRRLTKVSHCINPAADA